MVHGKNRFFNAIISLGTRNSQNPKWEVLICGIMLLMLVFIILLLCERCSKIFCCRDDQEQSDERTEYVMILQKKFPLL
jgi:hypothetical protein